MQLLEDDGPKSAPPRRKPRRSLKKRNSTLTQMDFFNMPPKDDEDFDDTMIESSSNTADGQAVLQLDGTYDSPRKPRKSRASSAATRSYMKPRSVAPLAESQEAYKPSKGKRRTKFSEEKTPDSTTRQSRRLATKERILSDPAQNFDYFARALSTPTEDEATGGTQTGSKEIAAPSAEEGFHRLLEVKDSTEDIVPMSTTRPALSGSAVLPQTPKKNTAIILSSQSPESLHKSTRCMNRRLHETPSKSQRMPLAQISVNAPVKFTPKTTAKKRRPSPRSKVIVLKLRKRSQQRRPIQIQDSQANFWSVPSSSPEVTRKAPPALLVAHDSLEIPATSQVQEVQSSPAECDDSLKSLPNLSTIYRSRSSGPRAAKDAAVVEELGSEQGEGIVVKDFAALASSINNTWSLPNGKSATSPSVPPSLTGENSIMSEKTEELEDMDFDLGSPIANDTQFDIHVQHRVPSSVLAGRTRKQAAVPDERSRLRSSPSGSDVHSDQYGLDLPDLEKVQSLQSSIPTPKLVERSSLAPVGEDIELGSETDRPHLPEPVLALSASIRRPSTQVPLKKYISRPIFSVRSWCANSYAEVCASCVDASSFPNIDARAYASIFSFFVAPTECSR